jgi:hypothetical protein
MSMYMSLLYSISYIESIHVSLLYSVSYIEFFILYWCIYSGTVFLYYIPSVPIYNPFDFFTLSLIGSSY